MGYLDCFQVDAALLKSKKLFLFDMDGTINQEDVLIPGAKELLEEIQSVGSRFVFITNNSSKSVRDYIEKMRRLGISTNTDHFFTAGQATALYLREHHVDALIYCMGTHSFREELRSYGLRITEVPNAGAKVVVVGFDTELTSEKIRNTCEMLTEDVAYIATNPDLACPVSFGFIPDCGAICRMIAYAVRKEPIFIGKPSRIMVDAVVQKFQIPLADIVVVGDRLYTDIATGLNAGVDTVCVLTGEATLDDIRDGDIRPTFTLNSVNDLYRALTV